MTVIPKLKVQINTILMLFLMLLVIGYSNGMLANAAGVPAAEQTVKSFFDALKVMDIEKISSYCADSSPDDLKFEKASEEKMVKLFFSKMKYEIISSETKDDATAVKAMVTNVDMRKIMEDMTKSIMAMVTEAIYNGEDIDDAKAEELAVKFFEESILAYDAPTVSNEVVFQLKKSEDTGKWLIDGSEDFLRSIYGN